ncbi:MAG: alpha/beta hydrolase [Burkholderiales bacterium]
MSWRELSPEALEREYSPRLLVPELQPYLDRYAELSAAARAALAVERDLAYGASADEVLDFFPAAAPAAPVHVFIHGGYWRLLSKDESAFPAPAFVQRGACFVALNYALAPAASLDEIVRQCRSAIAWLYRNARRLGGDPERIHVSGTSAGGHLVAMLLADGWQAGFGLPRDAVKGGCAVSGIFDLEPLLRCSINDTLRLDAAMARRNSPLFLPPRPGAALAVVWGEVETGEWKRQNLEYASACGSAGIEIPGRNHYDVILDLADAGSRLGGLALAQMGLNPP